MQLNHKVLVAAALAAVMRAVGCTNMNSPTGVSRVSFGDVSGATILGSVAGMGTTRTVAGGPGSSMRVTVIGTGISAAVSGGGRFKLSGVPAGEVVLQFSDTNLDASAFVGGVTDGEEVELEIALSETTASIVSETRRMTKIQLCHRTDSGTYHLIDIAAPAEPAHRAHGDGAIGDPVSETDPTIRFNEDCVPTSSVVTIQKSTNGADADQAPGPSVLVGDPVVWTYVVTNVGLVETLTGIVVADSDPTVVVDCLGVTSLAPGASMTCTATGVALLGPYSNVGTVTALAGTVSASASDASHYVGVEPTEGPKVQLCHRTGAGFFVLIEVGAPAEPAHLAHGDGKPNGAVPNQPGAVFGPTCGVTTGAPSPAP
jgi:hypothetical protein